MKSTAVYDCIKIPGAEKMTASPIALLAEEQCGGAKGLVTAADGTGKTVCSKYIVVWYCKKCWNYWLS